ncbi:methionine ABC transporter ATP-binding protein [Kitasatospora sp. NPDC101157]|uniref:methionine ABC transporter ATP-binding protein n=1 Tax=Kitasatospora sp. NPDC101157 TaxID=3364098 RepID=UPI0037FFB264
MIELRNVTKTFPGSGKSAPFTAVDDVSLTVPRGSVFGVIGHSGAGKSTLLRLINQLERPTSGSVLVDGQELSGLSERGLRPHRRGIGMVFQQFNLFNSRTVYGNTAYPLKLAGLPRAEVRQRAEEALRFVGLADLARRHPEQLSGGQRQRVGIARALAASPKVLLSDEATSALDPETTGEVLALLKRVNEELGITIVLITHEMDVIRRICDRVAVMDGGRVVESGEVYEVFANPQHSTTAAFVRSVLPERPAGATLERLRERHPGALVTVPFRHDGDLGRELSRLLRRYGLDFSLVSGGISEVGQRPLGSVTLELHGTQAEVAAFLADPQLAGVVADGSGAQDSGTHGSGAVAA